ncbi:hypothetical protein CLM62_03495 [Streptomyces sp. SA15]|uniref:hypothetical protein n=1 Tax=Streptomyces sp. SA15 TaxID=934019 RepID=UPI000BAE9E73|nr:hypothetical protein [Streptomyces sp. SA15]PAZ17247.1 hypothetical protein CLM62_03495 [Streptomyces sp. SA15]
MRKYQKAAVAMAMLGSVSVLGAGVGNAADGDEKAQLTNKQNQSCEQNGEYKSLISVGDVILNLDILGMGEVDNSKRKSVTCTQNFSLGR